MLQRLKTMLIKEFIQVFRDPGGYQAAYLLLPVIPQG